MSTYRVITERELEEFEQALYTTTVWYAFCCVWGGLIGRYILRRVFYG